MNYQDKILIIKLCGFLVIFVCVGLSVGWLLGAAATVATWFLMPYEI